MKKKIIILVILIVLIVLFSWGLFKGEKFAWVDLVDGKESIILAQAPDIRLISETRGEYSYQANYIDEESKDLDSSKKINKSLKRGFRQSGWKLKDEKIKDKYQVLEFQAKDKEKDETIKVVIGFENGRGTLFSFDYRWPPHSPH
ncbi:hypothetical protein ISS21_01150 [Patescibacteria group bacterium]|nr:hypothetical protein [Patescibacteria group bacterium]